CAVAPDPARQAEPERLHRELQRPPTGRMPQRALVPDAAARPHRDRNLAPGVQRGTTEEDLGRSDAGRLCRTVGGQSRYDETRTLKSPATESGGTSSQLRPSDHMAASWSTTAISRPVGFSLVRLVTQFMQSTR